MKTTVYMGDSSLPGSASYLVGIMTHFGFPFLHVPPDEAPSIAAFADDVGLYVLSDYPAAMLDAAAMDHLCARVRQGAGLLMLGGWESYHGLGGDWNATPVADLLPVHVSTHDDRRNVSQLVLVRSLTSHPITACLPFDHPPGIGGYNAFAPRETATVVLCGEPWHITVSSIGDAPHFVPEPQFPLLVVQEHVSGAYGSGRRACLATDVAPHWIGGFVDWGVDRLTVNLPSGFIEVGADYAAFFRNLLAWCHGAL